MKLTLDKINLLPLDIQKEFLEAGVLAKQKRSIERAQNDFMTFVKRVWPEFIEGRHHKEIANKFNDLANGKIKRLIINMPPRHTKSEFASFLLPACMIGMIPKLKIIQSFWKNKRKKTKQVRKEADNSTTSSLQWKKKKKKLST